MAGVGGHFKDLLAEAIVTSIEAVVSGDGVMPLTIDDRSPGGPVRGARGTRRGLEVGLSGS